MNDPLINIILACIIIGAAVKFRKPRGPRWTKSPIGKAEVMRRLDELINFYRTQNPNRVRRAVWKDEEAQR